MATTSATTASTSPPTTMQASNESSLPSVGGLGIGGGGSSGGGSIPGASSPPSTASSLAPPGFVGSSGERRTAELAVFAVPSTHCSSAVMSPLRVARLSPRAKLPYRATLDAAGWDLFAAQEKIVPMGGRAIVNTDLKFLFPVGFYGQVLGRSGLALNNGIDVMGGVVDGDFRGNLAIILANHGTQDFLVEMGDRIAQLVIIKILTPSVLEEVSNLRIDDTPRSGQGFGSTGNR